MKTTYTLAISALILSLFLNIGGQTSFAQEDNKKKVTQADSNNTTTTEKAKIEYTTPVISFLYLNKLTEPLPTEVRTKMIEKMLDFIKKDGNKKVPDLKSGIQENSSSFGYYEISGDLSGRKIIVQYILPVQGKNAGNISFSWSEKNEKNKVIENWFVSLFIDGLVETAIDSKSDKLMVSSGGKITVGAEHQKFWQLQVDQIIREIHERLELIGKLE